MKRSILPLLLLFLLLPACQSRERLASSQSEAGNLPDFEANDSEGNRITSNQFDNRILIIAFFDPDSVLAWRTLSQLARKQLLRSSEVSLLGFAARRVPSDVAPDIGLLKKEFEISIPIILDQDNHFSGILGSTDCCDYLGVYDRQGKLKTSMKLTESYDSLDSLTADSTTPNPTVEHPFALTIDEVLSRITVSGQQSTSEPLPIAAHGPTIVNFFTEFCADCVTGNRLETLTRLDRSRPDGSKLLIVFSEKHFSADDVDNFKALLPLSTYMTRGNIEVVEPHLTQGKLLIVVNTSKRRIWQETSGMTEEIVFSQASRVLRTAAN